MAGPSAGWLAQGYPMLDPNGAPPDPFAAGAAAAGISPPPPPTPPLDPSQITGVSLAPAGYGQRIPAPSPPPESGPLAPPPAPGPPAPDAGPLAPAEGPLPNDVQFAQVGKGGVVPAHEVMTRGPQQTKHLMASFDAPMAAAERSGERSQEQAAAEAEMHAQNAQYFLDRRAALEKEAVIRQKEMLAKQQDFESSVKQLNEMRSSNKSLFGDASTSDILAAMMLGGLMGGGAGAMQMMNKLIDKNIAQQRFDWERGLDTMKGKQAAYGLAMDRWKDADVADSMVRAASIDYMLEKVNEKTAERGGVAAANHADEARAMLMSEREKTTANAYKFLQASRVEPRYAMSIRGQMLPGTLSQADAQKYAVEHGIKPAEKTDEILTKGAVDMVAKRAELANKRSERADEGAKFIATEMQKAGVPRLRMVAEQALTALNASPGGLGEAAVRGATRTALPLVGDAVGNALMSDKANERERAFTMLLNLNFHELSGAAVSKPEEARLKRALGGSDPELRKAALQQLLGYLDEIERNIKGGVPPESQEKFDRQRDAAKAGRPAAPAGAKKGW